MRSQTGSQVLTLSTVRVPQARIYVFKHAWHPRRGRGPGAEPARRLLVEAHVETESKVSKH